jgi:two-component system response regulator HydG
MNSSARKPFTTTQWLILIVAAIGFLFDTYELLMFPVIGSDAVRRVDVRVVAATNQRLEVDSGKFRSDLFFRLAVMRVPVPPLRERLEDVPALVEHFLARARARNPAARASRVSPEVLARLQRHPWPGNVRELENLVERLVLLAPGEEIGLDALEPPGGAGIGPAPHDDGEEILPLQVVEDRYVAWVLERCGGDEVQAAALLGIDPAALRVRRRKAASA